jgi:hypothetical protein
MNRYLPIKSRALAALLALSSFSLAEAQPSPDSTSNSPDATKKERASDEKNNETKDERQPVVTLSPFQVKDNKVIGYYNEKAVEGSRIVQNIIDVPTSVTVINGTTTPRMCFPL